MNKVHLAWQEHGDKALERIDELLREPKTLLIDVRLNAFSWRVSFQERELRKRYRQKYHMAGKYLGNTAKWGTNLIRIASPVQCIQQLVQYLDGAMILYCCTMMSSM